MIEKSKYYTDVMKNILTNNLWWLNKMMNILETLLNIGFMIMFMLMTMLK